MWYIDAVFLANEDEIGENVPPLANCLYLNCVCLIYPIFYYSKLAINEGSKWFAKPGNYIHLLHIFLGYFNIFCQFRLGTHAFISKVVLIIVVMIILIKCFFFMRIVKSYSYIVTMVLTVVDDLKSFLLFFAIFNTMLSMIFDVIAKVKVFEYHYIGAFLGNWINTLKMAFADFNLSVIEQTDPLFELDTQTHYLYWFIWFICVIFSALILLNFIIAEVCNSYSKVKDNLEALIYKERATLI